MQNAQYIIFSQSQFSISLSHTSHRALRRNANTLHTSAFILHPSHFILPKLPSVSNAIAPLVVLPRLTLK